MQVNHKQNLYYIESHILNDDFSNLTNKEAQICMLLKQAFSNKKIANQLLISPRTVENHLRNIYEKLNNRSRANLISILNRSA